MLEWISDLDPKVLAFADTAASGVLALASVGVAAAAAWFTHKSNVGHAPIVFIKSVGVGGGGTAGNIVRCKFAVWNRRKYPLVVHEMQVCFGKVKLDGLEWDGYATGSWFVNHHNRASFFDEITIQSGEQGEFDAVVTPIGRGEGLFDNDNRLTVWVRLFDPIKNRMVVVRVKSRRARFWPALGLPLIPKIFKPREQRSPRIV